MDDMVIVVQVAERLEQLAHQPRRQKPSQRQLARAYKRTQVASMGMHHEVKRISRRLVAGNEADDVRVVHVRLQHNLLLQLALCLRREARHPHHLDRELRCRRIVHLLRYVNGAKGALAQCARVVDLKAPLQLDRKSVV